MARILGIDLPVQKRIEAALQYIYGVGPARARKILEDAQVDLNKRAKELTEEEISRITSTIQGSYQVEGDLRREVTQNIRRHMDIATFRGLRHRRGLPVRGQKTKNNSRTRKGRKSAIGGRKK